MERYQSAIRSDLDDCEDTVRLHGKQLSKTSVSPFLNVSIGRVTAKRSAGSRLFFLDIVEQGQQVQALCNFQQLVGISQDEFKAASQEIQRGDIVRMLACCPPAKYLENSRLTSLLRPYWCTAQDLGR